MHFIFRKSDRVILYITHTDEQFANEWDACLRNEGGVAKDYVVVEAEGPIAVGMVPALSDTGEVTFQLNPIREAKKAIRATLAAKLSTLGLTDDQVGFLCGTPLCSSAPQG